MVTLDVLKNPGAVVAAPDDPKIPELIEAGADEPKWPVVLGEEPAN